MSLGPHFQSGLVLSLIASPPTFYAVEKTSLIRPSMGTTNDSFASRVFDQPTTLGLSQFIKQLPALAQHLGLTLMELPVSSRDRN